MPKTKYPIFKSLHRGEKGFTLIELLIVVAILGVIAAVVALNIGGFMGTGTEEAANTEAHQVQTAIIGYMADNSLAVVTGGSVGPGTCGTGDEPSKIRCYLMNPAMLQATYTYSTTGAVTDATPETTGKWSACNFTAGQWTCP
ncbi:MAG: type II secretion system GspH family protein [Dehalococcoidia bacterium]|nr:type II secretion system GspH family protein [Dehalococcoidia bacterium]